MGSGISTVCGSKRSVLIANSVRKLPPIPENEVNSDFEAELDIKPRSGKLHPADSRDSGIGESEIPNLLFHRESASGFLKNSSSDSSPEKTRETTNIYDRPSRPHSCRLGHRGSSQDVTKKSRRTGISDSQIKRLVKSAKGPPGVPTLDLNSTEKGFESSDNDTLSNHSSPSQTRDTRPKSARRRFVRKNHKSKNDGRNSARTISDLDSSTDTENSDMDMLSIPDETGAFRDTPRRRGWVKNEDFTDVALSPSITSCTSASNDPYRIVSGTFSDVDLNLAKKASERSISSIILTPTEGGRTPTNPECFGAHNDLHFHTKGNIGELVPGDFDGRELVWVPGGTWAIVTTHRFDRFNGTWTVRIEGIRLESLEDLVNVLVIAFERQKLEGPCTRTDYETVLKSLRYQLVAIALNSSTAHSSPRLEVQGENCTLFSNDSWRVQIRLRAEDEEILETSEQTLAKRLALKGDNISKSDISILLAEHLRTIEKLQQVESACKVTNHRSPNDTLRSPASLPTTPKTTVSEGDIIRQNSTGRPKKSNTWRGRQVEPLNGCGDANCRLPPKGNSRTVQNNANSKLTADDSHTCLADSVEALDSKSELDSLHSSPESKPRNRKHFNESGIDSECEDTETNCFEDEEAFVNSELVEAFHYVWDSLTDTDLEDLLAEYRRRQKELFSSFGFIQKSPQLPSSSEHEQSRQVSRGSSCGQSTVVHYTDRQLQIDKDILHADREFVSLYCERRQTSDLTFEAFCESLTDHMKKTKLIRVQSFREDALDCQGRRSNSFTGFGQPRMNTFNGFPLARQHSFSGSILRQHSYGGSRQNSFIRSLQSSRQSSFCRTRSRGSTGSSYTTSSGITSDVDERSGSLSTKSSVSREISFGMLNDFEDIDEHEESRQSSAESRDRIDSQKPPAGRKQAAFRLSSTPVRDRDRRRAGQTQVHGLGAKHTEPLRKIEEDSMPKVEEVRTVEESKLNMRSRPDSGIAVSTSSASYSSSDALKEPDDIDEASLFASCQEMVENVAKVRAEVHNDMKSLVAAITKGLNTDHSKAHALYCWLVSQDLANFSKSHKKHSSPTGKLRQLYEKKTFYSTIYIDMLKVAGLRGERIDGYMKTKDYLPGNTVQTPKFQHSWVAVSMDGQYRLVDPQCGATGEKFVMDHYFATSPDELMLSHFPKDTKWLLMNQIPTMEGFEGTLKTWPAMFHYQIRPLNMKSVIKTYDGRLSITVLLRDVAVNPQLEYAGPGPEIDSDTLEEQIDHEIRDVDNAETYHVSLPQEGNYYFTVYAHVLEDCVDVPVFQYRIEYKDELL